MRWRLWMKVSIGAFAMIVVLVFANNVMVSHRERALQAQEQNVHTGRDSFSPRERFQAASPLGGLMESIRPHAAFASRATLKTVSMDLSESVEKPMPAPPQPPTNPLKLIRTGQVSIEVAEFEKAAKEVGKLIESLGGYVADTQPVM